ncbi:MAG TPA: tripartite tricarboxylate transporter substrate binding protein [Burkholderiales bacterium]|nr:tripartite tricarboxylate transporter substrate binding protein [Burkholderiales bacterium]
MIAATKLAAGTLAAAGLALAAPAPAADYPNKPVRLVVGQPPGGPTDLAARVYADKMRPLLGQPMIVENKPGAASQIAIVQVAKSEPDGYAILYGGLGLASLPWMSKSYDIDSLRDTTPISMIVAVPTAIAVSSTLPNIRTLDELIADTKANPGKRFYGSMGATDYLTMQGFRLASGSQFESIRFNGAAPAFQSMYAGDVQIVYTTVGILKPLADQGKLRILAVAGKKRSALVPDVPTLEESKDPKVRDLPNNLLSTGWFGIVGPAKLPQEVVTKLNGDTVKVTHDPDFAKRMADFGLEPLGSTPEEFAARLRVDLAAWQRITKQMNFQPE